MGIQRSSVHCCTSEKQSPPPTPNVFLSLGFAAILMLKHKFVFHYVTEYENAESAFVQQVNFLTDD